MAIAEFKISLTDKQYLELKKQAMLDRKKYAKELDAKKERVEEARDCIVAACADDYGYQGETRSAYYANFLIPDDYEFDQIYQDKKSKTACQEYFGVPFKVIQDKDLMLKLFGKYKDLYEVEEALAKLDKKEDGYATETLELNDEDMMDKSRSDVERTFESRDARKLFSPLEYLDVDTQDVPTSPVEDFEFIENNGDDRKKTLLSVTQMGATYNSTVERQTEEALEKIKSLFEKNDTKEQKILALEKENEEKAEKIKTLEKEVLLSESTVSSLQAEIKRLQQLVVSLEEKITDLTGNNIGLQEENVTLRKQNERIIAAINEKYGEYVGTSQGKTK